MIIAMLLGAVMMVAFVFGLWLVLRPKDKVIDDFSYDHPAQSWIPVAPVPPSPQAVDIQQLISMLAANEAARLTQFAELIQSVTESVGATIAAPYARVIDTGPPPAPSTPVPFYATVEGTEELSYDPMDELIKRSRNFGGAVLGGSSDEDDDKHWTGVDGLVTP